MAQLSSSSQLVIGGFPFLPTIAPTEMRRRAPQCLFGEQGPEGALGSKEWGDAVFESAMVGGKWSRGRVTHRHQIHVDGQFIHPEGYEDLVVYVLEYLKRIGAITRWKPQPFEWQIEREGAFKVPDFLVEIPPERLLLIIQAKSARFITVEMQAEFDKERQLGKSNGMEHVVWTDKRPLNQALRNLFLRLRGARHLMQFKEHIDAIVSAVEQAGQCTTLDLVAKGYDPGLFPAAINTGRVFVDIRRSFNEHSLISSKPLTDTRQFLLCAWDDPTGWWNSLSHN
jgi:hypothetical protein